jgi:hypothetical protein
MKAAVDEIPSELHSLYVLSFAVPVLNSNTRESYKRIWERIQDRLERLSLDRIRQIMSWIAFARRPLKKFELQSALSYTDPNKCAERLLPEQVADLYKPLIEERTDSTYTFVHGSVKR